MADVERFSRWLGRDVEVVVVYMDDDDWHDVVNPWFIGHDDPDMDLPGWVAADPAHRRLVVSQALAPEDEHDWRSRGAAGDYDEHWEAFARRLVNAGLGRSVIRLAWEMNGSWYASHYTGKSDEDLEHWKAYWRRAVQTMRGVEGADFLFEWSPNAGPSSSGLPFVDFYPGDDVVDVVGLDSYDFSVGTPRAPEQRWRHQWSQLNGVQDFVELAESHGKPMAFGEWAVVAPCDCNESNGIGDNPTYVSRMADVVRDHDFVYQAYFNVQDGGINMRLNDAPKSSGVYRARFGPLGDAVGS